MHIYRPNFSYTLWVVLIAPRHCSYPTGHHTQFPKLLHYSTLLCLHLVWSHQPNEHLYLYILVLNLTQQRYPIPSTCPTQSFHNMGQCPLGMMAKGLGLRLQQGACLGTSPLEVEPPLHLGFTPAQGVRVGVDTLSHPPKHTPCRQGMKIKQTQYRQSDVPGWLSVVILK